MAGRRIAAAGLLIVSATALTLGYVQFRRQRSLAPPLVHLEIVDRHPIVEGLVEGSARLARFGDGPRARLPDTPPLGHLYHVAPVGDDQAEGSRELPWRDLAGALCRLQPGDRLYILPGTYSGPFAVGSDCQDGTADRPIEVYASDDSTLVAGPDPSQPVLAVAKAWWRFEGVELSGGSPIAPSILFAAGARHVTVVAAHLYGSGGDGIQIRPGSEDILIQSSHLHHLGLAARRGAGARAPVSGSAAAVRIFPGTKAIRLEDNQLHNVWGEPVRIVARGVPGQRRRTAGASGRDRRSRPVPDRTGRVVTRPAAESAW